MLGISRVVSAAPYPCRRAHLSAEPNMVAMQRESQASTRPRRSAFRTLAATTATVTAVALFGLSAPMAASAAVGTSPRVLINEVYGGGGNANAPFNRDFVELVNTSGAAVDLSGWSLQYASATGSSWTVDTLTGTIPSGSTWVVGQALGAGTTLPSLAVNDDGTLARSGTAGKIALVQGTTALTGAAGNAAGNATVVDFVGFGPTASDFAGAGPTAILSNSTSASRDAEHKNTANNAGDFTVGAPTPQPAGVTPPDPEPEPVVTATIAEVQGTGAASTLVNKTVNTRGVVTASYATGGFNGYVIQTPGTGGAIDLATHTASDGLFIYSPSTAASVAIGDYVDVTGVVTEYFGLTQITVAAAADLVKLAPGLGHGQQHLLDQPIRRGWSRGRHYAASPAHRHCTARDSRRRCRCCRQCRPRRRARRWRIDQLPERG